LMQGAGAISEAILVCKPFFRTLLEKSPKTFRSSGSLSQSEVLSTSLNSS